MSRILLPYRLQALNALRVRVSALNVSALNALSECTKCTKSKILILLICSSCCEKKMTRNNDKL